MPPLLVPPARVVLTAPELEVPFLCLAPPPPPARGEEVPPPRGLPAPTLVALAAGPGILCVSTEDAVWLLYVWSVRWSSRL